MRESISALIPWGRRRRLPKSFGLEIVKDGDAADQILRTNEHELAQMEVELSRRYIETLSLFGGSIKDYFLRRETNELEISPSIPLLFLDIMPVFPETLAGEDALISCFCQATHGNEAEVRIALGRIKAVSADEYQEKIRILRQKVLSWRVVLPMVSRPNESRRQETLDHTIVIEDISLLKERTNIKTTLGGMASILRFATFLQSGYPFSLTENEQIRREVSRWPYSKELTPWAFSDALTTIIELYKKYHDENRRSAGSQMMNILNRLGFLADEYVRRYQTFQQIENLVQRFISLRFPSTVSRTSHSFEYHVRNSDMTAVSHEYGELVQALNGAMQHFVPTTVATMDQLLAVFRAGNIEEYVPYRDDSLTIPFLGSKSGVSMSISVKSASLPLVDVQQKVMDLKSIKKKLDTMLDGHIPTHSVPNLDEIEFTK